MKLYKVQDLGLPERWNNFTVFSSEVARLVLLSERGRTHGSIWGVPPFLEGIFRATITATMTTSYFYSYIETTSYQTTYTITIKARQSAYSLTGEFSGDLARYNGCTGESLDQSCYQLGVECYEYDCDSQNPSASSIFSSLTANGIQIVRSDRPVILYFGANETVTVSAGTTGYTISGNSVDCWSECNSQGCYCVKRYKEWKNTYKFQAIELVDWDTGEIYASVNQNSLTFNINRNTIVRFEFVLESSWSREWTVILRPPPPPPDKCPEILNDPSKVGSSEWCACTAIYDPQAHDRCVPRPAACLYVSVKPCCSGSTPTGCLSSWSGVGDDDCKAVPATLSASWSASWSLYPGWRYKTWGWQGDGSCSASGSGSGISGTCWVNAESNKDYRTLVVIIFERT